MIGKDFVGRRRVLHWCLQRQWRLGMSKSYGVRLGPIHIKLVRRPAQDDRS